MTNTLNRRQALTGAAAIAAGATIATAASAQTVDPDQHLIDLWNKWRGLQQAVLDALEKAETAEFAARKKYPKQPEGLESAHLTWRKDKDVVDRSYIEFNRDFVRQLCPSWPQDVIDGLHCETMKIYDAWEVEKATVDESHNVPTLRQALADVTAEQKAIEIELINTPSTGVNGVLVKLSFWAFWTFDGGVLELGFAESGHDPASYAIKQSFIDMQRLADVKINTTHPDT